MKSLPQIVSECAQEAPPIEYLVVEPGVLFLTNSSHDSYAHRRREAPWYRVLGLTLSGSISLEDCHLVIHVQKLTFIELSGKYL